MIFSDFQWISVILEFKPVRACVWAGVWPVFSGVWPVFSGVWLPVGAGTGLTDHEKSINFMKNRWISWKIMKFRWILCILGYPGIPGGVARGGTRVRTPLPRVPHHPYPAVPGVVMTEHATCLRARACSPGSFWDQHHGARHCSSRCGH